MMASPTRTQVGANFRDIGGSLKLNGNVNEVSKEEGMIKAQTWLGYGTPIATMSGTVGQSAKERLDSKI